jgi:hypothetical protein
MALATFPTESFVVDEDSTTEKSINVTKIHVSLNQVLFVILIVLSHSFGVWFMIQKSIMTAINAYDAKHSATPHLDVDPRLDAIETETLS